MGYGKGAKRDPSQVRATWYPQLHCHRLLSRARQWPLPAMSFSPGSIAAGLGPTHLTATTERPGVPLQPSGHAHWPPRAASCSSRATVVLLGSGTSPKHNSTRGGYVLLQNCLEIDSSMIFFGTNANFRIAIGVSSLSHSDCSQAKCKEFTAGLAGG